MTDSIILSANKLVKRLGTRDPFQLSEKLGVIVRFADLGNLKGMYTKVKRNRYILINEGLDDNLQRIICAHELGHDQRHRKLAENRPLRDFVINQMKEPIELEANMYAAEILFDDDEILELVDLNYTVEQIAMHTGAYKDLIAIKLALLRHKGHRLNDIEYNPYFLK